MSTGGKGSSILALLVAAAVAGGCRDSTGAGPVEGGEAGESRPLLMIALSFDDNYDPDGMEWALELLAGRKNADGSPVHASFMINTAALDKRRTLRATWLRALRGGHEIGNHTHDHNEGRYGEAMTEGEWRKAVGRGHAVLTGSIAGGGLGLKTVRGFRAPRGETNDAVAGILDGLGYSYDSSRPGHWSPDGKWPEQVPGTGLWELAISWLEPAPEAMHPVRRVLAALGYGRLILAVDMSMFSPDGANLTKEQALATLKCNVNRRRNGDRAPLVLVGHTHIMGAAADDDLKWRTSVRQRREFYREFLDHVGGLPGVRIVSNKELVDWLETAKRPFPQEASRH